MKLLAGENIETLAIDFETHLISKDGIFPKPVCLSHYDGEETGLLVGKDIPDFLHEVLIKKETILIAHNAVFECGVIVYHYPELTQLIFDALEDGRIYCTKIAEELNNVVKQKPLRSLSLASLVNHYFDTDISASKGEDAWRLRYSELEDVPLSDWPIEATQYAIDDSIWAHKVHEVQSKVNQVSTLQAAVFLNLMGSTGMNVDLCRVAQLKNEVAEHLRPHYAFLVSQGLCKYNKNGKISKEVKKLQEYIEQLNIKTLCTSKGSISVKAESLEGYAHQIEDKVLQSFMFLAVYEKVQSAYLSHMTETPIFSQYSAVKNTGRTSASGSKLFPSLNVQQMPRQVKDVSYDVRNCFVPGPGFKILSIDYAGLELASTAHQLYTVFKKSAMRDTLNDGEIPTDMHSKLAAYIKKIPYDEFMKNKSQYKEARQLAKPINLGFPGGLGYDTMRSIMWKDGIKTEFKVLQTSKDKQELRYYLHELARSDIRIARTGKFEYSLVKDELVKLKRDFFNLYPELEVFLKETHKKYLTGAVTHVKDEYGEWVEEPMYLYDVFGFKRDWCMYTAFCNGFLMQTPSAIGAKKAVAAVMRKYWKHPDVIPLAFIHDEILFSIRDNKNIEKVSEELSYIMIDAMKSVLSSVRITVEASLSDFWQKADGYWTEKFWR